MATPGIPLLGFLLIGLLRNYLPKTLVSILGCGSVLISFLISCVVFKDVYDARAAGGDGSFSL